MEFWIITLIILLLLYGRYGKIMSRRRAKERKQAAQEVFEARLAASRLEVLEAEAEAWKAKAEEFEAWAEAEARERAAEAEARKRIPEAELGPSSLARRRADKGIEALEARLREVSIELRERKPFSSLLEHRSAEARKLERKARKLAAEVRQ